MEQRKISGRLVTGLGQGAHFTRLDWASREFIVYFGIDAYPGTVNLVLDTPGDLACWAELKSEPGVPLVPPSSEWCSARAYPVRIEGWLPAAVVVPNVSGYPPDQVEIVAALPVRKRLGLNDRDRLTIFTSPPLSARAVIFDVDGTLVDSLEAYRRVAELAAAPHGISITRDAVRRAMNTDLAFWETVVGPERPDRAGLIRELKDAAVRHLPEVWRSDARLYPGLAATLERLKSRGFRMGIVTASGERVLQPLQDEGLLAFFDATLSRRDVQQRKPHPEGLLKCSQMLQTHPAEAVYVGDTALDVQASRAAAMASVAVLSGAGDSALLSAEGPDRMIHSHARLPEILSPW